jgi:PEP-CTERM motif
VPGGDDIDTIVFCFVDIYQTTTNTDTYLNTSVYEMVGVVVPEPGSVWLLGLGGIALALYRWRLARAAGAARPRATDKTYSIERFTFASPICNAQPRIHELQILGVFPSRRAAKVHSLEA